MLSASESRRLARNAYGNILDDINQQFNIRASAGHLFLKYALPQHNDLVASIKNFLIKEQYQVYELDNNDEQVLLMIKWV